MREFILSAFFTIALASIAQARLLEHPERAVWLLGIGTVLGIIASVRAAIDLVRDVCPSCGSRWRCHDGCLIAERGEG